MNRWISRMLVVLLLLALSASAVDAQRRRAAVTSSGPRYGPHLGFNFDLEELFLGAQLSWPITPRLDLYPTFDYYFVSGGTLWALNFDVKYRPPTRYSAWYVGGGLNYLHASAGGVSGSDTNLNLITGLESRRGRTPPFVEARFILGDGSSFQLGGGINFR